MFNRLFSSTKLAYILLFWVFVGIALSTAKGQSQADTSIVISLLKRSTAFQRINLDSCQLLAEQAMVLSRKLNFAPGIRGAHVRLGSVLMTHGANRAALPHIQKALAIDLQRGNHKGAASDQILLAYIFSGLGEQAAAFEALYAGIRHSEQIKDTALQISIYTTMGELNADFGEPKTALSAFQKALKLAELSNQFQAKAAVLMGIGNVHYLADNFTEALTNYLKVDALSQLTDDRITQAQNLNNIALCQEALGNLQKAEHSYAQALHIYQQNDMASESANIWYNLGILQMTQGRLDSALSMLQRAAQLAQTVEDLGLLVLCYDKLAAVYALQSNFSMAYQLRLQHATLQDSLMNIRKMEIISGLKTQYETEQKALEISFLQTENSIKDRQNKLYLAGVMGLLIVSFLLIRQGAKLRKARNRSNKLLLNILPAEVAEELKATGISEARLYNDVSVLFTDFVNFTGISEQLSPTELVAEIHQNFTAFDEIIEQHGLEKIKTIGDAYMAVCGLPQAHADHAQRVVDAALAINRFMNERSGKFQIRIGIHSGPVVAGIVGIKKYAYDIWGDTVNTAARMEQHSEPNKVNISGATHALLPTSYRFVKRGKIAVKNKGDVEMFFVEDL